MRDVNQKKIKIRDEVLGRLDEETLRRGFYGTATIEVEVADGTIIEVSEKLHKRHR